MSKTPFPGPRPYRADDRARFFGRDEIARELANSIMAQRCLTVFGPSGAGKSSLLTAAVVPSLEASYQFRVVRVDGWPAGREAVGWLCDALHEGLKLGQQSEEIAPPEGVIRAMERGARRSERPVLVYLDQIEQLLYPSRGPADFDAIADSIAALNGLPMPGLRIVLSLREDYLGRMRDRARACFPLLDHGFRVEPLTVAEISVVVCQAASLGDPPRHWSPSEMRDLLMAVRTPGQLPSDDAEAQTAYAQIVCRALWAAEERSDEPLPAAEEAERILQGYLENTLAELGPLKESALRLLEDHLISVDGSRTLRTEKELASALGVESLRSVLDALEGAAVLRAAEHHGTRYFELGHDWLAKRVHEQKQGRALAEARFREQEQRRAALARLNHIESVAVAVRTPLNDIIGYCELLMEEAQDAGRTDLVTDLARIEGAGRRLSELIDDIIEAASAEPLRVTMVPPPPLR